MIYMLRNTFLIIFALGSNVFAQNITVDVLFSKLDSAFYSAHAIEADIKHKSGDFKVEAELQLIKRDYSGKTLYRFSLNGFDFAPFQVISDGVYIYEVRPNENVYRTFSFPDSITIPLINRTSTLPYNQIFFDSNYLRSIMNDRNSSILDDKKNWILRVDVSETLDEGSKLEATIDIKINKNTYYINSIERRSSLNNLNKNYSWQYSNIRIDRINQLGISRLVSDLYRYENIVEEEPSIKSTSSEVSQLTIAPNISGIDQDGNTISLNDFKGNYVLLDFWETWCLYCITAFPKLENLAKKYANENFTIIGVTKENKKLVQELIEKNKFLYPNIFTDQDVDKAYNLFGRPQYILIAPDGKIIGETSTDLGMITTSLLDIFGF
jgi:thiol-disulfide isomerase/thioredoxin